MLINLSNHPLSTWTEKQIKAATREYNSVVDLPFPNISPYLTDQQVKKKAEIYLNKCLKLFSKSKDKHNAVHLMGEFTFVFHLTNILKEKNIPVVVSTTERIVENVRGKKIVTFNFIKFREY